jgi:protocatechuate 3,4-dioxygenase beta subunit
MRIDRGLARRAGGRPLQPGRLPLLLAGLAAATGMLTAGAGSAVAADDCPRVNPPNALRLVAGSGQTAKLGTAFQTNLQVALANTNGCPVTGTLAGVEVRFTAPASGASGAFAASGTNVAVVGTDVTGGATAPPFTANDSAGSYSVHADSPYGSVDLQLTNTGSGVPASIVATGGTGQTATVNSQYEQPLQAQVLDTDGRPVQGASVTFALATGLSGASASFLGGGAQASATTNASGQATSPPLLANTSAGRFTASASTSGIANVATFALTNHAAANTLSAITATRQSATVGTRYRRPLRARLLDSGRQPIEGATVTFMLPQTGSGAGASFVGGTSQATATTDGDGQATSPPLVANSTPGSFTAAASVPGIGKPVSYQLRNLPGRLTATGSGQAASVGQRYRRPLTVRLLAPDGQPIEGATVTFTLPQTTASAGASFPDGATQATATTDASGRASSPPLVANNTAGHFTATATVTGNPRPARYALRNLAGRPATITAGAASGESTPAGSRFPIPLAVTVEDADGNPVAGARVTFTAPADGPSGRFTTRTSRSTRVVRLTTNAKGVAVAPAFTANRLPGGYIVTAATGGQRAAFALINRAPGA